MSRRHQSFLTAGVLLTLGLGLAAPLEGLADKPRDRGKDATQSYGPKVAASVPPAPEAGDGNFEKIAVMHGSEERVAYVHVPPGYNPAKPAPVMFGFHGGKGRVNGAKSFSRLWRGQFDSEMILVFLKSAFNADSETSQNLRQSNRNPELTLCTNVVKGVPKRLRVYQCG